MTRLWLFDFDGTLVNSEKAIKDCYLEVGKELVPKRCGFIKNMMIGHTLDESSKSILTVQNLHLLNEFKKRFEDIYDNVKIFETVQYPDVNSTLIRLFKNGDHMCIVTNKRYKPTHKLINYYGWSKLFYWVECIDKHNHINSKIELIKYKKIQQKQYDAIYLVGDTLIDGLAANENNIAFIKANYGYGKNENWKKIKIFKSINNFSEILELV